MILTLGNPRTPYTLEEILPLAWVVQGSDHFLRPATEEAAWRTWEEQTFPLYIEPLSDDAARLRLFGEAMLAIDSAVAGRGYGVLVLLVLFSGLRWEELAALRVSRVRFGNSPRVEVVEALTEVGGRLEFGPTKNDASRRQVPLPDEIANILQTHVENAVPQRIAWNREPSPSDRRWPVSPENEHPDPLLFATSLGYPISRTSFRNRVMAPAARRLGFDPLPKFHHLRHSYAAWQIQLGTHPKKLQELMGHASIRTTLDLYGHLMETLESRQYERMNEALRTNGGTLVARKNRGNLTAVPS